MTAGQTTQAEPDHLVSGAGRTVGSDGGGFMQGDSDEPLPSGFSLLTNLALLGALAAVAGFNFLLFHTVAEFYAIFIALMMFVTAWHSFPFSKNNFLMFLACGYLGVAFLDGTHALSYKGMQVFATPGANMATQFWLGARYLETAVLLVAPMFSMRAVRRKVALASVGVVVLLVTWSIFEGVFPTSYVDGTGLTTFKIVSEYVISVGLGLALVHLYGRRQGITGETFRLLRAAILVTMLAELTFTLYETVYSPVNAAGHILKVVSFGLIYRAIVLEKVVEPLRQIRREVAQRRQAQASRAHSEERYRQLFELADQAVVIVEPEGLRILESNHSATQILGFSGEELATMQLSALAHPSAGDTLRSALEALAEGGRTACELELVSKGGDAVPVEFRAAPITVEGSQVFQIALKDLTQQRELERHAQRSTKMETVGALAGGLAHDFNNCLTVVMSNLEVLRFDDLEEGEVESSLDRAMRAVQRGARLSRRLLDFARSRDPETYVVDVNRVVEGVVELFSGSLGARIDVKTRLAGDLWPVRVCPDALEDALLNLVLNARDAMPGGGELTIATARGSAEDREGLALDPEQCVVVTIQDNGTGMSEDALARVFEPFYSTKPQGKGTGLGLSMVTSFVRQSAGELRVRSKEGQGTTIEMFLPRYLGRKRVPAVDANEAALPKGRGERILVVDDEPELAQAMATQLRKLGYLPQVATTSAQALAYLGGRERVDAMVTDVVMPEMNGFELADAARTRVSSLGVLLMSAFEPRDFDRDNAAHVALAEATLRKPYTLAQLAHAIDRTVRSMKT